MGFIVGVNKIFLEDISYKKRESRKKESDNNLTEISGTLSLDVEEKEKKADQVFVDAKIILSVEEPKSKLDLVLQTVIKLTGELEHIEDENSFDEDDLRFISQPLFSKASEIIAYITGNTDLFPNIIDLDYDNIIKEDVKRAD